MAVVSGSGQTATVATGVRCPLVAVVKDAYGNPVPGVSVIFAAPASGASATLSGSPAVTGADGQASVTATAGTIAGSYTVTASVAGVTTAASFELSNCPAHAATVARTPARADGGDRQRIRCDAGGGAVTDCLPQPGARRSASPSPSPASGAYRQHLTARRRSGSLRRRARTYATANARTFAYQVTDNCAPATAADRQVMP